MSEETDVFNKKNADKTLIIAGVIIIIGILALFTNGFGLLHHNNPPSNAIPLAIESSPVLGEANAPVTIYEFSDYSCPFCAAAEGYNPKVIASLKSKDPNWQAPVPAVIENYVKTGKAKLIFKYTPGHGSGEPAHQVALALNEQGLFWKFHDLAFKNQEDTGNLDKMKALAQSIGANMTQLDQDLKNKKDDFTTQLRRETAMGKANEVEGTPSFFINGKLISGAQSYSVFKQLIDQELAK